MFLFSLLVVAAAAKVIIVSPQVPAWSTETIYAPLDVFVGDSLTFRYAAGEHNVVRFPSQQSWENCFPETTPGLQLLCGNWENMKRRNVDNVTHAHVSRQAVSAFEDCTITFTTPGVYYYACTHDFGAAFIPMAHCVLGQRIKVTVHPLLACHANKRRSLIASTHTHKRRATSYEITPTLGWIADSQYLDLSISVGDSLRFDFLWTHDVVYTQNQALYNACDFSACTFPGTVCPGGSNSWTTLAHPIPPQNLPPPFGVAPFTPDQALTHQSSSWTANAPGVYYFTCTYPQVICSPAGCVPAPAPVKGAHCKSGMRFRVVVQGAATA